ncbi:hypothetical protein [Thomasclavelia ramosa]|uniref:hypothetical protein n=1 Tax=Thomasclavelia ramosa TaxID=1547 RepID=UPI0022E7ED74|nr:hypothetical protein [Thomasclavelia ramosa]
MLRIEKIKDEIKNFDTNVNAAEILSCWLHRITTNSSVNKHNCSGLVCSECLRLSLMDLLEEYKEPIKLTKFEYEYLKVAKKEEFNFIARDGDGRLFLYKNKPLKSLDEWIVASKDCCRILDSLLNFVKWEDEEPWKIDSILSNCEQRLDWSDKGGK